MSETNLHPHELCCCAHPFEDHDANGCHYDRPKYLPEMPPCSCKQFFWLEAAPEVLAALKNVYNYLIGLHAYLLSCENDVITANLESTSAFAYKTAELCDAAICKAKGE